MADAAQLELYRASRAAQDKYDYFLLAASGAAIAFALSQTRDQTLSTIHLPLGLALLCWGFSFYTGCKHLSHLSAVLYDNSEIIQLEKGNNPIAGRNLNAIAYGRELVMESMKSAQNKATSYGAWQFRSFFSGGVMYIIWHVAEMAYRVAR